MSIGVVLQLPSSSSSSAAVSNTAAKRALTSDLNDDEDADDEEEMVEVRAAEQVAEFEEVVIWGHEAVAGETEDPYARGVGEWIAFAEAMHCEGDEEAMEVKGGKGSS